MFAVSIHLNWETPDSLCKTCSELLVKSGKESCPDSLLSVAVFIYGLWVLAPANRKASLQESVAVKSQLRMCVQMPLQNKANIFAFFLCLCVSLFPEKQVDLGLNLGFFLNRSTIANDLRQEVKISLEMLLKKILKMQRSEIFFVARGCTANIYRVCILSALGCPERGRPFINH